MSASGLATTEKKRRVAQSALAYVESGMLLGVGTGSTVGEFIEALKASKIRLRGAISSSRQTSERLQAAGIEDVDLNEAGTPDLYVDGADEATRRGMLIKGGGAALTREKIVAAAARRFVCIIDDGKLVEELGAFPLPVEVIPMARSFVAGKLRELGGDPAWRHGVLTDNGNHILDVRDLRISRPRALETAINGIAGVVSVGLFAHRGADLLLVAGDAGVYAIDPGKKSRRPQRSQPS